MICLLTENTSASKCRRSTQTPYPPPKRATPNRANIRAMRAVFHVRVGRLKCRRLSRRQPLMGARQNQSQHASPSGPLRHGLEHPNHTLSKTSTHEDAIHISEPYCAGSGA